MLTFRKDKYERKVLWFYVDISFTGTHEEEDEEQLHRSTDFGEADARRIPLGLGTNVSEGGGAPPPPISDEELEEMDDDNDNENGEDDDDDDDDDDIPGSSDDSDDERGSKGKPQKKKPKLNPKKSFDEEIPEEAGRMLHKS